MAAPIKNERDLFLQNSLYRSKATSVSIGATSSQFKTLKNGGATAPSNITLVATPNNVFTASAAYKWEYALSTTPTTWVTLATTSTVVFTNTNMLAIIGTANKISLKCTVSEASLDSAVSFYDIDYLIEASDPLYVNISRVNSVVAFNQDGSVVSYANTDANITVYRGSTALAYSSTPNVPNTFNVSIDASSAAGRTLDTITAVDGTYIYNLAGITAFTTDLAKVIFQVTTYDASGVSMGITAKEIVYTKVAVGTAGTNALFYYLGIDSAVISKSTSSPLISGSHTNLTIDGWQVNGATKSRYGYITVTGNGDSEALVAVETPYTTSINNTAGKTYYTIKLYSGADKPNATLLDTQVVPVLFVGASTVNAVLTNTSASVPVDSSGNVGVYTNTSTDLYVYEGTTELNYDTVGTSPGTWKVTTTATGITAGAISDLGNIGRTALASNMILDTAYIVYNITGTSLGGKAFTAQTTQTFSKAYAGAKGTSGAQSVTINAVKWSNSGIGSYAQVATYNWATHTISAYPSGWTNSVGAAPGTGYTLYQISLVINALADVSSSTVDWTTAITNTIGYRLDGSIGPQGNSHRTAYIISYSGTTPSLPTAGVGDVPPVSTLTSGPSNTVTSWSYSSTSTLISGQYMYQSDGIYNTVTNAISWGNPYLSNLKVGSLSAISADLGTITAGSLNINNKFMVDSSGNTTIQGASTGTRLMITNNYIKIYNGDILRVQLGDLTA